MIRAVTMDNRNKYLVLEEHREKPNLRCLVLEGYIGGSDCYIPLINAMFSMEKEVVKVFMNANGGSIALKCKDVNTAVLLITDILGGEKHIYPSNYHAEVISVNI